MSKATVNPERVEREKVREKNLRPRRPKKAITPTFKFRSGPKHLKAMIHLPNVPTKHIQVHFNAKSLHVNTLQWKKKYFLTEQFPAGLKVVELDDDEIEAEYDAASGWLLLVMQLVGDPKALAQVGKRLKYTTSTEDTQRRIAEKEARRKAREEDLASITAKQIEQRKRTQKRQRKKANRKKRKLLEDEGDQMTALMDGAADKAEAKAEATLERDQKREVRKSGGDKKRQARQNKKKEFVNQMRQNIEEDIVSGSQKRAKKAERVAAKQKAEKKQSNKKRVSFGGV